VSMGTVAAMAVGAVALANRGGGSIPGPATQVPAPPAPVAHDGEPLECDDALPAELLSDSALAVDGELPSSMAYGSDLMTTLRWWAPGAEQVRYSDARIDIALVQGDVVVGVASSEWPPEPPVDEVELGSTET